MFFAGCAGHRTHVYKNDMPDMAFSGYSDVDCDNRPDEVYVATSGTSRMSLVCANDVCIEFPGYTRSVNFETDRVVIDAEADGNLYRVYYRVCNPKGIRV